VDPRGRSATLPAKKPETIAPPVSPGTGTRASSSSVSGSPRPSPKKLSAAQLNAIAGAFNPKMLSPGMSLSSPFHSLLSHMHQGS
jgi:hypothetical protein